MSRSWTPSIRALRTCFPLALLVLFACAKQSSKPVLVATTDEQACIQQLRQIHKGLIEYRHKYGHPPEGSGAQFLAALLDSGVWANDAEHARLLTCPGVDPAALGLDPSNPADWYRDPSQLTGDRSAYAARDQVNFPLDGYPKPGKEPVVACDNHLGPNHKNITNVLYADGTVVSYELDLEIERGNLPAGSAAVPVAKAAPETLLELRRLSQE